MLCFRVLSDKIKKIKTGYPILLLKWTSSRQKSILFRFLLIISFDIKYPALIIRLWFNYWKEKIGISTIWTYRISLGFCV